MKFIEPWNIHEQNRTEHSIANVNLIARNEKRVECSTKGFLGNRREHTTQPHPCHCWEAHNMISCQLPISRSLTRLFDAPCFMGIERWRVQNCKTKMSFWLLFQSDDGLGIIIQPQNNIITTIFVTMRIRIHIECIRVYFLCSMLILTPRIFAIHFWRICCRAKWCRVRIRAHSQTHTNPWRIHPSLKRHNISWLIKWIPAYSMFLSTSYIYTQAPWFAILHKCFRRTFIILCAVCTMVTSTHTECQFSELPSLFPIHKTHSN